MRVKVDIMNEKSKTLISARHTADLLTFSRALLGFILVWLGLVQGAAGLVFAVYLLLMAWTTDALDGPIARRGDPRSHSWIGNHDLEVDMAVSGGLLVYMVAAGFITPPVAGIYAIAWALIFWRWGLARSLGMLFQAPIYGWFIWVANREARPVGQLLIIWIAAVIIVTWPRFPKTVIPDFLQGMAAVWRHVHDRNETHG